MKVLPVITVFLFLASCSREADPYPWFQGLWISDPGQSMANNPQYDRLEPEDYSRVRDMYGKVRWNIVDRTMEFYDPRSEFMNSTEFSVEAVDEDSFQVSDDWGGNLRIWKSRTGFCMETITLLELETITECFQPLVAETEAVNL